MRIDHHVFQDRPETNDVIDLWFRFFREADGLRVATALEVENAVVAPAVLIVADEPFAGVGRKGCLAGTRKAEKQSNIPSFSYIGGAVHR